MANKISSNKGPMPLKKSLNFVQLTMMIFALTSGGPFGIEAAVQSGGIQYTLIGLIVLPFLYSLPQSLMCSELGALMPSFHGYIVWSFRAFKNDGKFGHFLGFYNAIGNVIAMGTDIPIYVTVILFYFEAFFRAHVPSFTLSFTQRYIFKFSIVIFGGLLNVLNISIVGSSTLLLMFIVFVPFVLGFVCTIQLQTTSIILSNEAYTTDGQYQWGLFLSTLFWCHTGWDSVGCLTADIKFKNGSKLLYAFLCAIVLDYISYTIPILGGITQKCEQNCWNDGYLYTAYNAINPTLGLLVLFAGFVSNFGIYISELSVQARTFWSLAQPFVLLTESGNMYVESERGTIYNDEMQVMRDDELKKIQFVDRIRIGMIPHLICGTMYHTTGSPIGGVLLQSLISCIFIIFDFSFLIQASVVINCLTWLIEMASFLRLRYSEPNTVRPYKVPGGMAVAWIITVDKFIVVLVLIGFVLYGNPEYLYMAATSFILSLLWFVVYCWNIKRKEKQDKLLYLLKSIKIQNYHYGATALK